MRDVWVATGESPTVYRYIDWLLTITTANDRVLLDSSGCCRANSRNILELLIGTLIMLIGGFMGEAGYINPTVGFIIGMAGWIYILYEVFAGEGYFCRASSNSDGMKSAFGRGNGSYLSDGQSIQLDIS